MKNSEHSPFNIISVIAFNEELTPLTCLKKIAQIYFHPDLFSGLPHI